MFPLVWVWWLACLEKISSPIWPGVRFASATAKPNIKTALKLTRLPFQLPTPLPRSRDHARRVWKHVCVTRRGKSDGAEKTCPFFPLKVRLAISPWYFSGVYGSFPASLAPAMLSTQCRGWHANVSVSCDVEQQSGVCPRHKCLPHLLKSSFLLFYLSFLSFSGRWILRERGPFLLAVKRFSSGTTGQTLPPESPGLLFVFFCMYSSLYSYISQCYALRPSFFPPPPPSSFIKYTCQSAVITRTATGSVTSTRLTQTGASARGKCPWKRELMSLEYKVFLRFFLFIITANVSYSLVIKVHFVFCQRSA